MTNPSGRKGAQGERDSAKILSDLTGFNVKRKLGAGRKEDTGDLWGVPDTVVQVADYTDVLRAIRHKPIAAEVQRGHAEATFAFSMIKMRGGIWRCVLTPEQMATYIRESLQPREAT